MLHVLWAAVGRRKKTVSEIIDEIRRPLQPRDRSGKYSSLIKYNNTTQVYIYEFYIYLRRAHTGIWTDRDDLDFESIIKY